jgi:hypothetical protein
MATKKGPAMRPTGASVAGFLARHQPVLARLGPHKAGKGCLYLRRLDDVDHDALRELIDRSVRVRKGIDRSSA